MAPGADPAFQQAMDKLLLQVNPDNVLAVHRAFETHARDLQFELKRLERSTTLGRCGGDPISEDVLKDGSFGGKIRQLVEVHWRHWEELTAVSSALRDTARRYGHTEDAISASFPEPR